MPDGIVMLPCLTHTNTHTHTPGTDKQRATRPNHPVVNKQAWSHSCVPHDHVDQGPQRQHVRVKKMTKQCHTWLRAGAGRRGKSELLYSDLKLHGGEKGEKNEIESKMERGGQWADNHRPCQKSLVRQQRSHCRFRLAVFGSPLVQLIETTLLQFSLKESWCFQRGLDEQMNGEERKRGSWTQRKNAEEGWVLSKKMGDGQSRAQKEDPVCCPLIQYTH